MSPPAQITTNNSKAGVRDRGRRKWALDLVGPGYQINRSNQLVLESKADMQKRGQASPDDGDALALTLAQTVAPAEVEGARRRGRIRRIWLQRPRSVDAMSPHPKGRTKARQRAVWLGTAIEAPRIDSE
jgi:hypothetical protein